MRTERIMNKIDVLDTENFRRIFNRAYAFGYAKGLKGEELFEYAKRKVDILQPELVDKFADEIFDKIMDSVTERVIDIVITKSLDAVMSDEVVDVVGKTCEAFFTLKQTPPTKACPGQLLLFPELSEDMESQERGS